MTLVIADQRDKVFTPTKAVAFYRELRQAKHALKKKTLQPEAVTHEALRKGLSRDIAAEKTGLCTASLTRAEQIMKAAERDPSLAYLVAEMDETGNIAGTYRKFVNRKAGKLQPDRNPAQRKMRYREANRELARAIDLLDGICYSLRELQQAIPLLQVEKRMPWAKALKNSAVIIKRLARRLEDGDKNCATREHLRNGINQ